MQVVKNGVIKDYCISKNLPANPNLEKLKQALNFTERLIQERERYLKEQYYDLKYKRSDFIENPTIKNEKRLKDHEQSIEFTLRNLKIEKEDLRVLKDKITQKEWELYSKNKDLIKQISMF